MAHAYTPGLTITPLAVVRRERRLPLKGQVLVAAGDRVGAATRVARCAIPGAVQTVNLSARLSVEPARAGDCLLVPLGGPVRAGEPVAEGRSLFGLVRTVLTSPCDGRVESLSLLTGQLLIREPQVPVEIDAYVRGVIQAVLPDEGVIVETRAALLQGIFGVGGETFGRLAFAVDQPGEALLPFRIGPALRGRVVVGGAHASFEALQRAREVGVAAVVVGGFDARDLRELLGHDLGVAITGAENLGLTVVITEGFGRIPMAARAWDLLRAHDGREASVSGATQIRAGVVRPEILIPHEDGASPAPVAPVHELVKGVQVRVIREPWFGRLGRVVDLIEDRRRLETEALVRVVEVEFTDDHTRGIVPRANVEVVSG